MKLNSYETLVGFVRVDQELQHHHSAKVMVAQDLLIGFVDIPPLGRRTLMSQILRTDVLAMLLLHSHTGKRMLSLNSLEGPATASTLSEKLFCAW